MRTEKILMRYPALVKFLTGLPAESFWEWVKRMLSANRLDPRGTIFHTHAPVTRK